MHIHITQRCSWQAASPVNRGVCSSGQLDQEPELLLFSGGCTSSRLPVIRFSSLAGGGSYLLATSSGCQSFPHLSNSHNDICDSRTQRGNSYHEVTSLKIANAERLNFCFCWVVCQVTDDAWRSHAVFSLDVHPQGSIFDLATASIDWATATLQG